MRCALWVTLFGAKTLSSLLSKYREKSHTHFFPSRKPELYRDQIALDHPIYRRTPAFDLSTRDFDGICTFVNNCFDFLVLRRPRTASDATKLITRDAILKPTIFLQPDQILSSLFKSWSRFLFPAMLIRPQLRQPPLELALHCRSPTARMQPPLTERGHRDTLAHRRHHHRARH